MTQPLLRACLGGWLMACLTVPAFGSTLGYVAAAGHPQCDVAPRSYESLTALLETPPSATPPATTSGETLEEGTPASATERQHIRAVIEQWLACQNEGKLFSAWALFSDAYLYRLISRQPPITEPFYEDWATP